MCDLGRSQVTVAPTPRPCSMKWTRCNALLVLRAGLGGRTKAGRGHDHLQPFRPSFRRYRKWQCPELPDSLARSLTKRRRNPPPMRFTRPSSRAVLSPSRLEINQSGVPRHTAPLLWGKTSSHVAVCRRRPMAKKASKTKSKRRPTAKSKAMPARSKPLLAGRTPVRTTEPRRRTRKDASDAMALTHPFNPALTMIGVMGRLMGVYAELPARLAQCRPLMDLWLEQARFAQRVFTKCQPNLAHGIYSNGFSRGGLRR
jgi:hypothetical protein